MNEKYYIYIHDDFAYSGCLVRDVKKRGIHRLKGYIDSMEFQMQGAGSHGETPLWWKRWKGWKVRRFEKITGGSYC